MAAFLTYANDSYGKLVHVSKVEKGKKCNCTCPECKSKLVARKGKYREHHFAHTHGQNCVGAIESALHRLAKQIIIEAGGVMLPESNDTKRPSGFVTLKEIKSEHKDEEYGFIPDVEGIMEDGTRLMIEILVTHKVQDKKHNVIVENNLSCIEIDLTYQNLDEKFIRNLLLKSSENRYWIEKKERPKSSKTSISYYSQHPIRQKIKSYLREGFVNNTFLVYPWKDEHNKLRGFDLKAYRYDTIKFDENCRGMRCDILLYRSQCEDRGYLAINIRRRRRSDKKKIPEGIKVIDIVIDFDEEYYLGYFSQYTFISGYRTFNMHMDFAGFKDPVVPSPPPHEITYEDFAEDSNDEYFREFPYPPF